MTVLPLHAAHMDGPAATRAAVSRLAFPVLVVGLLACAAGYGTVVLLVVRAVLALLR